MLSNLSCICIRCAFEIGREAALHVVHGWTELLSLLCYFTGLLLMFYYRPTLEYAYTTSSVCASTCRSDMREMHRWGAHAMVITVWLHMFRVFMTDLQAAARVHWSIGVIMLVLTLLLSFTATCFPGTQLAYLGNHRWIEHGPGHAVSRT